MQSTSDSDDSDLVILDLYDDDQENKPKISNTKATKFEAKSCKGNDLRTAIKRSYHQDDDIIVEEDVNRKRRPSFRKYKSDIPVLNTETFDDSLPDIAISDSPPKPANINSKIIKKQSNFGKKSNNLGKDSWLKNSNSSFAFIDQNQKNAYNDKTRSVQIESANTVQFHINPNYSSLMNNSNNQQFQSAFQNSNQSNNSSNHKYIHFPKPNIWNIQSMDQILSPENIYQGKVDLFVGSCQIITANLNGIKEGMNKTYTINHSPLVYLYEYDTENLPRVSVINGNLKDVETDVIVNFITLNTMCRNTICNEAGEELVKNLNKYTNLGYIKSQKMYQVPITNSGQLTNKLKAVMHVFLSDYDGICDISEIEFKSAIKNLIIFSNDYKLKSVTLAFMEEFEYNEFPLFFIPKWIDDLFCDSQISNNTSILSYYQEAENSLSLSDIKIFICDKSKNLLQCFKNYFNIEKPQKINLTNNILNLDDNYKLIEIGTNDHEFKLVKSHFIKSIPNGAIMKIEKIENQFLKSMYNQNKTIITMRNGSNAPLEYNLFHGSAKESIQKICKFGFNRSYCGKNGTAFGKGVYFARNAAYSHKYSSIDKNYGKNYQMILSKVLVGIYQVQNSEAVDTGMRPDGNQYDSNVDNLKYPQIFVIYKDYRAYPEYLITYKV